MCNKINLPLPGRPGQWWALLTASDLWVQWPMEQKTSPQTRCKRCPWISASSCPRSFWRPSPAEHSKAKRSQFKCRRWSKKLQVLKTNTRQQLTFPTAEKKSSRSLALILAASCMQKTVRASLSSGVRLSIGCLRKRKKTATVSACAKTGRLVFCKYEMS